MHQLHYLALLELSLLLHDELLLIVTTLLFRPLKFFFSWNQFQEILDIPYLAQLSASSHPQVENYANGTNCCLVQKLWKQPADVPDRHSYSQVAEFGAIFFLCLTAKSTFHEFFIIRMFFIYKIYNTFIGVFLLLYFCK